MPAAGGRSNVSVQSAAGCSWSATSNAPWAHIASGAPSTGPGFVEFTVELRKGVRLSGPRVETADYLISVGAQAEFQSSLDRALQLATVDMIQWLTRDYKLEPWAAHILIGYQGRYDVVTVAGSMALRIPKRLLPPR